MQIIYNNLVLTSVVTSSSDTVGYEATTAFSDSRLCRVWRTLDDASESCVFDAGAATAATDCVILNHNFTSGATVTLQANATNVWTSPSFTTSSFTARGDKLVASFASQSYRYWRVVVADASNPDDYLEIGMVAIGTHIDLPPMTPDQSIPVISTSETGYSTAGQLYGDRRIRYKSATINFPHITNTQKTTIDTFAATTDVVEPFILYIWEENLDVEPPIYCSLTKDLEWKRTGQGWSLSLSFRECF